MFAKAIVFLGPKKEKGAVYGTYLEDSDWQM